MTLIAALGSTDLSQEITRWNWKMSFPLSLLRGFLLGGYQVRLAPCDCCSGLRGSGRGRVVLLRAPPLLLCLSGAATMSHLQPTTAIDPAGDRPAHTHHPSRPHIPKPPISSSCKPSYLWHPGTAPRARTISNLDGSRLLPDPNFQPPAQFKLTIASKNLQKLHFSIAIPPIRHMDFKSYLYICKVYFCITRRESPF